jgi:vacuolar-type H+-ATPase subunit I/STV1
MSPRTIFLSRLIGVLTILISLAMLLHKQSNVEAATALVYNLPLSLVTGMAVLICGLAIVLGHNVWSGGVLPIVVTIYGWSLLIRGALLLCLSSEARGNMFEMLHLEDLFLFYVAINLSLGIYLTYGGFRVCLPQAEAGGTQH